MIPIAMNHMWQSWAYLNGVSVGSSHVSTDGHRKSEAESLSSQRKVQSSSSCHFKLLPAGLIHSVKMTIKGLECTPNSAIFMYIFWSLCIFIWFLFPHQYVFKHLNEWTSRIQKNSREFILSNTQLNSETQVIPSENQINDLEILIPDS